MRVTEPNLGPLCQTRSKANLLNRIEVKERTALVVRCEAKNTRGSWEGFLKTVGGWGHEVRDQLMLSPLIG